MEKAERPTESKEPAAKDPMQSTTGHSLVATGPVDIEVDLGESVTKTGGRVVMSSDKLDRILEELEEELLTSDMAPVSYTHLTLPTKA